jgi:hypothetical protein
MLQAMMHLEQAKTRSKAVNKLTLRADKEKDAGSFLKKN